MLASLPYELLYPIVEQAASTDRETAYSLCLVAPWSREIAERYLYAVIETHHEGGSDLFRRWLREAVKGTVPSHARYVRHLWLEALFQGPSTTDELRQPERELDPELLINLLWFFPNLESISWAQRSVTEFSEPWRLHGHVIRASLSLLRCRSQVDGPVNGPTRRAREPGIGLQLTLNCKLELYQPQGSLQDGDVFGMITHLRLNDCIWVPPRILSSYRNLTHIALTNDGAVDMMIALYRLFPRALLKLEMYVIEIRGRCSHEDWVRCLKRVKEERNSGEPIFTLMRHKSLEKDWEEALLDGGQSIWDRARTFTSTLDREDWTPPLPSSR